MNNVNDNEQSLTEHVVITLKEYKELLKCKTKAQQYKRLILETQSNSTLTKAMIAIEDKNLYQLIDENKKENKESEE